MAYFHTSASNPTSDWAVIPHPTEADRFTIGVEVSEKELLRAIRECPDDAAAILEEHARMGGFRLHTSAATFDDEDEASEWLEAMEERWEEQYDDYLEENSHEIARMERYEAWRNEY